MQKKIYDVVILGAGASGMMCAAHLNEKSDLSVLLVEGNDRAAKKLKISGGGKCNITNVNVSTENYLGDEALVASILSQFTKEDLLGWLEARGLRPILRKEQYYFCPKSSDEIITILQRATQKSDYAFQQKIKSVSKKSSDGLFTVKTDKATYQTKQVVVATGAKSYASIGATEIGVSIANSFGHTNTAFAPALAGLTLQPKDFWMKSLSGISFPVKIEVASKLLQEDMLLTHRGLSGPAILSASLYWNRGEIIIDLLPKQTLKQVMHNNRKLLSTALSLPKRFTQLLLEYLMIKDRPCNEYKDQELQQLQDAIHSYKLAPAGTYGFTQAEVCKGGVDTMNLNSWTLESHLSEGIYFIGEVVDVTGELGGYNFQWAFSSGVSVANAIIGGE